MYKACSFPFGNDATAFDNGCTSVPEEIRAYLRQFRCYKGGNEALWALNVVCNRDKHALVIPVLMGYNDIRVHIRSGTIESPKNPF